MHDAEWGERTNDGWNAVKQINNWVSDKTGKKIPEIVTSIYSREKVFLINVTYFKGIWKSKFKKSDTKEESFYPEGNLHEQKVSMMKQSSRLLYSEDIHGRYLRLFYGNGAFNMILILPQDDKTVDDVIASLNVESWKNAMQTMATYEVNLSLPRFKSECEYEMQESILPTMGMRIPFSPNADFNGISDVFLFISRVVHKTFVEVNEEGTESASVSFGVQDSMSPSSGTIDYIVNKPFTFAICENSTGVILFMGKIGVIR